jgi:hypothetical protein
MSLSIHPPASSSGADDSGFDTFRDPRTFVRVFVGAFLRDIHSFYPGCRIEPAPAPAVSRLAIAPGRSNNPIDGLQFEMADEDGDRTTAVWVSLFGTWHRLVPDRPMGLGAQDRRLIRAVASVLELNFQILFRRSRMSILQLRRGMPEDHYVAAWLEPSAYAPAAFAPSRIAEAILTLRTMALSTFENRRVTTGALILGQGGDRRDDEGRTAPPEALDFGVELTSLKSLHRLCDGRRTLFLVDREGKLADVIDIRRWAARGDQSSVDGKSTDALPEPDVPCARPYAAHARATREGGDVCLVLSPNQEIKVFAEGVQAFVFAHGRWRVLDPQSKFAVWQAALANPNLARLLFQAALDLAEERQGGLLVVVADPSKAIGRLLAPQDVLDADPDPEPDPDPGLGLGPEPTTLHLVDPRHEATPVVEALTKRSIRYLAGNRSLLSLDASVVEALASLDGALVADSEGRLLAFGAILRHDALNRPKTTAEGARTTAAIVASRFGPVLKVSEDGIVSCFLGGERVWDL